MACLVMVFSSCMMTRSLPKYEFARGYYTARAVDRPSEKVYVAVRESEIQVYALRNSGRKVALDTLEQKPRILPYELGDSLPSITAFWQTSFDIDFVTIPLKYRFPIRGFPKQFNANVNGAVYLGYRSDVYVLKYERTLLGTSYRRMPHIGFSFGGFSGLGGTAMNPWVTHNVIEIEYDGVVWTKGVATIIGLNAFTVGVALGWDHLLDRNKQHWIYQGKPWIGLAFGLNLN
jgi:hypothetical protein